MTHATGTILKGLALATVSVLLLATQPALADDSAEEIAEAALHAGYASNGAEIGDIHTHLQHVVNCLVGPDGVGFHAGAGNPCDGMGAGAIADTSDADTRFALESALTSALSGLGSNDIITAKDAAGRTQETLEQLM
ncbi:MAG: hypothetical protein AAF563_08205 [Pseudomonadota bacterium]